MDYRIFFCVYIIPITLHVSLSEPNDLKGELKSSYADLLNSIIKLNTDKLKIHKKLYRIDDIFGRGFLRSIVEELKDYPKSFLVDYSDDSESDNDETYLKQLIKSVQDSSKNKVNLNTHNFLNNLQDGRIANRNDLVLEGGYLDDYTDKNNNNDVAKLLYELKHAIAPLNVLEDGYSDKYLRAWSDSSSEEDSEVEDAQSLKKLQEKPQATRDRPIDCTRGRKFCRRACREAAREFCRTRETNVKYCSYRSRCRSACRMWF